MPNESLADRMSPKKSLYNPPWTKMTPDKFIYASHGSIYVYYVNQKNKFIICLLLLKYLLKFADYLLLLVKLDLQHMDKEFLSELMDICG